MFRKNEKHKPVELFITAKSKNLRYKPTTLQLAEKEDKNIILVILSMRDFDISDLNLRAYPYPTFILDKAKDLQPAPYNLIGECIEKNAYKIESDTLMINKKRILLSNSNKPPSKFCYAILSGKAAPPKPRTLRYYSPGLDDMDIVQENKRETQLFTCSYITHQLKL